MAWPHGSAISFLHQLSAFGCLAHTGLPFINKFSPRLLDPHGSTLRDLFNYEDGGHVVVVTNLNENAYNFNIKVTDFKRTNMLALPPIWRRCCQLEREGQATAPGNLKEDIMLLLPPTLKEEIMCQEHRGGYAPSLPTSTKTWYGSLKTLKT